MPASWENICSIITWGQSWFPNISWAIPLCACEWRLHGVCMCMDMGVRVHMCTDMCVRVCVCMSVCLCAFPGHADVLGDWR